MAAPFENLQLLAKFTGFSFALLGTLTGAVLPGGHIDTTPFKLTFQGDSVTEFIAGTEPRSTVVGDAPANTIINGGLAPYVSFKNMLFDGTNPDGHGTSDVGTLDILDISGALDSHIYKGFDGCLIEIYRGAAGSLISSWAKAAALTAAGMSGNSRTKQIALRPLDDKMLKAQLHDVRFAGTGGYEGDTQLKGQPKPYLVGRRFNITPVLLNTLLIYQFSFTACQAVYGVRDGGGVITFSSDYADYATLAAAAVAPGYYSTCLALGLIKLGGAPTKGITIDAAGDNETIGGVGYVSTRAAIARRIVLGRGGYKLTTADLDETSFTTMDAGQPGTLGYYFTGEWTKGDALNLVMKGCGGVWWFTILGIFKVDYFKAVPTTADITVYIPGDGQDPGDYLIVGEPELAPYSTPRRMTQLGWQPNSTIQDAGALQPSPTVTPTNAAIYGLPAQYVNSPNQHYGRAWPTSPIVTIDDPGFFNSSEAQTEATRIQALTGVQVRRFTVECYMDQFADPVGKAIRVRGWYRYGFKGSRICWCVGVDVRNKNRVILHLLAVG